MPIVVDSNVLIVLTSGDPRQSIARHHLDQWVMAGEELHAPALLPYEVANAFARLVATRASSEERIRDAWRDFRTIRITYHEFRDDGERTIAIAQRLRRQNAYDASYLALAERLRADVWTFDGPLYRNAVGSGFPIHLMQ